MKRFLFLGLLLCLLNYSFLDAGAATDNSLAPFDEARAERTRRLFDLCQKPSLSSGDLQEVDRLLAEGVDVNQRVKYSHTPLIAALMNKNIAVIKKLLEIPGINIWKPSDKGLAPLYFTSSKKEIAKLLLSKLFETIQPPFVKERDGDGKTILFYAIECEDYDMIKQLLAWGAEPNTFDLPGITLIERVAHIKDPTTRDQIGLLLFHFGMFPATRLLNIPEEKSWLIDIYNFHKNNKAFLDSIISDKEKVLKVLSESACPVCYELKTNTSTIIPCMHWICRDCYRKLERPKKCPLCRGDAEESEPTDNIYTEEQQKGFAPMATE